MMIVGINEEGRTRVRSFGGNKVKCDYDQHNEDLMNNSGYQS